MFYRGDKVLIYSGTIDISGVQTSVELATIEEVGEYELLVYFDSSRNWSGPHKVSRDRCMPIVRTFDQPKPAPIPEIGDLVMIFDYDIISKELKKTVGNVQTLEYYGGKEKIKIMVENQLKSFDIKKCFIIQKAPRKIKDTDETSYIINVTKKQRVSDDKETTITKTIPVNRDSREV